MRGGEVVRCWLSVVRKREEGAEEVVRCLLSVVREREEGAEEVVCYLSTDNRPPVSPWLPLVGVLDHVPEFGTDCEGHIDEFVEFLE